MVVEVPPASDDADVVAKQLRDCIVKRHEFTVEKVQEIVDSWRHHPGVEPGAYVNTGNANGKTALHFAAQLRGDGIADLLLQLRADVGCTTARGHTPLIYACGRGRDAVVLSLLKAGARCHVKTANGDTALAMAKGRVSDETMEALLAAEAAEAPDWLDFTHDENAIRAQADHVLRCPQCAQWPCDVPPAVASLVAERRREAAAASAAGAGGAAAADAAAAAKLADEVALTWLDPATLAAALLRAVGALHKKRAGPIVRQAVAAAAARADAPDPEICVLALARVISVGLLDAARRLAEEDVAADGAEESSSISASTRGGEHRHAKFARIAITSALLPVARDIMSSSAMPVAKLVEEAPAWMTVELLTPPSPSLLERDGPALEAALRKLCREGAWGTDFGTALRWLRALQPRSATSATAHAAFNTLGCVFVEAALAAYRAGHPLKRHMHDNGSLLREVPEVLGEEVARPLLQAFEVDGAGPSRRKSTRHPEPAPALEPPPDAPFLRLPQGTKVTWVADAASWLAAEQQILESPVVALDTEWWDTGNGPALVQVAVGQCLGSAACFLLDTLSAPQVLGPGLRRVFACAENAGRPELLGWSFREDQRRLQELCQTVAEGGVDGFPAFAVSDLQPECDRALGSARAVSLAVACGRLLGQPLDKTEQCSDWRRRPLTERQLHYAALDAAVLLELRSALRRRDGNNSTEAFSPPPRVSGETRDPAFPACAVVAAQGASGATASGAVASDEASAREAHPTAESVPNVEVEAPGASGAATAVDPAAHAGPTVAADLAAVVGTAGVVLAPQKAAAGTR